MKELEPPTEFPDVLSHVWSAFCALSGCRTQGFNGANPIGFRDIKDFIELTNTILSPRDIDLIRELDILYMGTN